jgi:hypothetical protein
MSSGFLQELLAIELLIDADATGGLNYITTRAFTVIDAVLVPTAVAAAAVATLDHDAFALSAPMPCAAVGVVDRPVSLQLGALNFIPPNRLGLTTSGGGASAAARCVCTVYVAPPVDVVTPLT